MAAAKLIQKGDALNYTNSGSSAVTAGSVVVTGTFVGIVQNDIPAGGTGSLALTGVWEIDKGTATFTLGAPVYWDATNGYAAGSGTNYMGRAWAANSSSSAGRLLVRLEPGGNAAYANA